MKDELSNVSLWFKTALAIFLVGLLVDLVAARWFADHFPNALKF